MRTESEKKLLASIKTVGTFTWEGAMRIKEVFEKVRPYLWWKGVDELSAAIHAVESGRLDVAESIARGRGLRHVSGATKNLKNAVLSIQTDRKNGNNNEGTHLYDALKLHKKEHKMSEEQIARRLRAVLTFDQF
jgi:hypothetical protein